MTTPVPVELTCREADMLRRALSCYLDDVRYLPRFVRWCEPSEVEQLLARLQLPVMGILVASP